MITDSPLLIKKLKRWQCYRQIIDCYQQYKCVSCLARQFRMSTDEANIIAGIIDTLTLQENNNND